MFKEIIIKRELVKVLEAQKGTIEQQTKQLSNDFKKHFQDEDGQTYLLAIDPYYYMRTVENSLDHGYGADKIVDGQMINDHMTAPVGKP